MGRPHSRGGGTRLAGSAALKAVPTVDHRFRIEHVQVLDHADVPRYAQLSVIPSMQAVHQTSDMYWAPTRLGYARTFGAYAWRSLLNTGVIIPNGSDFPVERIWREVRVVRRYRAHHLPAQVIGRLHEISLVAVRSYDLMPKIAIALFQALDQ